jgi:hypothetical protein
METASNDSSNARISDYLTRYYKPNVYWWESVHILKRICIIVVGKITFDDQGDSKYFATFFFLLAFLLLEVLVFPYSRDSLMKLSIVWNTVALFLLISDGLIFRSKEISEYTKSSCAITLIILVVSVLLYSTHQLAKSRFGKTRNQVFQLAQLTATEPINHVQSTFQVPPEFYSALASNRIQPSGNVHLKWRLPDASIVEEIEVIGLEPSHDNATSRQTLTGITLERHSQDQENNTADPNNNLVKH